MSIRLVYTPPTALADAVADPDDAVYSLAAAGATASIELGERYHLTIIGTGLAELRHQVLELLEVLRTGRPAYGDDRLRSALPNLPAEAVLHSWIFSNQMLHLPLIVFAIDGATTYVFTRTISEGTNRSLKVEEDRDLVGSVTVQTAELINQARIFLNEIDQEAVLISRKPLN